MSAPKKDAIWLFDLGNSRLKAAWLHERELAQPFALAWDAPEFDAALPAQLAHWPAPARVLVASVTSASSAERLRRALQIWPRAELQWLRTPRQACDVTTYYRIPERLGIDRFMAMIAARIAAHSAGVIVAGCGTALTLDAVDATGAQREGLIAPSPQLMLRSLRNATGIADANQDAFAQAAMDDSARALHEGCSRSAAALVAWYCAQQRTAIGDAPLYLHGGWAAALHAMLEAEGRGAQIRRLDNAVLRGMAIWAGSQSGAPAGS